MQDCYHQHYHYIKITIPYHAILHCTTPYYTTLHYTILYHTIPYYTILYHTIPYHTIPYYIILYYTILYYTILYYTILYYTILYYTILYYILYYTILYQLPSACQEVLQTLPAELVAEACPVSTWPVRLLGPQRPAKTPGILILVYTIQYMVYGILCVCIYTVFSRWYIIHGMEYMACSR